MHLYFLLPLCSSYVLNDDNDDIIYIYIYVCVCVCNAPSSFQIDPTRNAFWPSSFVRSSNILFFFFFRTYFEDIFVRHLMHNKQNLQTFYLLEKEKKNKKSIQKIDTVLFYPHTRLKRALIGLVATELHLSISLLLRRRLLLLLHREEARISGVE